MDKHLVLTLELGWIGVLAIFAYSGLATYVLAHDPFWVSIVTFGIGNLVFFATRTDWIFLHRVAGYMPACGIVGTALGFSAILPLMADAGSRAVAYQHAGAAFLATIVGIIMWVLNDLKSFLMERSS